MRVVVQRSKQASVSIAEKIVGEIDFGLVVLLGIAPDDSEEDVHWLCKKVAQLRIFPDEDGKMNRSLIDVGGGALVISQFTLYGNCRKGRRPNFTGAARPDHAIPLYEYFCRYLVDQGISKVATGQFGAMMQVKLINDGPVTLVIDSKG